jgi:hypothetical protein
MADFGVEVALVESTAERAAVANTSRRAHGRRALNERDLNAGAGSRIHDATNSNS